MKYWLHYFLSRFQTLCVATLLAVAQAGYLGGGYAGYSAPVAYATPAYHAAPTYAAPGIIKAPVAYKAAPAVDYYVSSISRASVSSQRFIFPSTVTWQDHIRKQC